jgi:hypothetical protein
MIDARFTSLENCQLLQPHNYSAVYFLRRGEEIVYVGQSKNVACRIAAHINKKLFDSVLIMPVPEEVLSSVEMYWITRLKPNLNRSIGDLEQNGSSESPYPLCSKGKHCECVRLNPRRVQIKGQTYWQVSLGSETRNGRRIRLRRTFSNRADAETFAKLKQIEQEKYGPKSIRIPERFWREATEAARILAPFGVSLSDAADEYIHHQESLKA